MTFKQNTKMSASGSHYCAGGKVKKMAGGGGTGFVNVPQTNTATTPSTRLTQKAAENIVNRVSPQDKLDPRAIDRMPEKPYVDPRIVDRMPNKESKTDVTKLMQLKKGGKVTRGNKRK